MRPVVASAVYGDPRFTRGVDLVMELNPDPVDALTAAFAGGDFYLPRKRLCSRSWAEA